jgi:hypothetical protein
MKPEMKEYISLDTTQRCARGEGAHWLANNPREWKVFHATVNAAIEEWIKSQGDVELPEPIGDGYTKMFPASGTLENNTRITVTGIDVFSKDQLLEVSTKYKARLAQCEAALGQARDGLETCSYFDEGDNWEILHYDTDEVDKAITTINELIGEKK